MTHSQDLIHKVALALTPGIGGKTGRSLLAACGSPEAVFREKKRALVKIDGVGRQLLSNLKNRELLERAEKELEFVKRYDISCHFITDESYPSRLKSCVDAPLMLFIKGSEEYLSIHTLAVVGTRNPSEYGRKTTESLGRGLSESNVAIISGLAYGIDTAAHNTSLLAGLPTAAVLAHGLDTIYPGLNRELATKITGQGCLVTEFPRNTRLNKDLFPRRNRIIAGLSEAVVVVESGKKGGGLITADIASSYNRDVFAIPGNVGNKESEGPNFLIKTNRATLVESADDIIYFMGWDKPEKSPTVQRRIFTQLSEEEALIYKLIEEGGAVPIDKIYMHSQIQPSKVNAIMLKLEFEGLVKLLPGNRYTAI